MGLKEVIPFPKVWWAKRLRHIHRKKTYFSGYVFTYTTRNMECIISHVIFLRTQLSQRMQTSFPRHTKPWSPCSSLCLKSPLANLHPPSFCLPCRPHSNASFTERGLPSPPCQTWVSPGGSYSSLLSISYKALPGSCPYLGLLDGYMSLSSRM